MNACYSLMSSGKLTQAQALRQAQIAGKCWGLFFPQTIAYL